MSNTISITVDLARAIPVSEENIFKYLWEHRGLYIQELLDSGERSLPRVLARLNRRSAHNSLSLQRVPLQGRDTLTGRAAWTPVHHDASDRNVFPECAILPTGMPAYRYAMVNGQVISLPSYADFSPVPVAYVEEVLNAGSFDAVVEIGSGLGERLFQLHLGGAPAGIHYFGAELWEEGRTIATRLAALEPAMHFTSAPFDLKTPDFSFVAGYERVLIFTNAALYAVTRLPETLFPAMAQAAPRVEGIHFEFVGHQRPSQDPRMTVYAEGCRQRGYNENFLDLLEAAMRDGHIHSVFTELDQYSNSSRQLVSLISWKAGPA